MCSSRDISGEDDDDDDDDVETDDDERRVFFVFLLLGGGDVIVTAEKACTPEWWDDAIITSQTARKILESLINNDTTGTGTSFGLPFSDGFISRPIWYVFTCTCTCTCTCMPSTHSVAQLFSQDETNSQVTLKMQLRTQRWVLLCCSLRMRVQASSMLATVLDVYRTGTVRVCGGDVV